jgi:tetratricopeptide (TPR) repeat protein
MLVRAVIAGGRSVIWFATFALFERVPWSGRVRGLALSAGVAACLANLCVSGGISFPSVAQPLWLVAGLALASRGLAGLGASRASAMRPGMIIPLPLAVGFLLGYWIYVLAPIRASESLAIAAHEAARAYRIEQSHGFRQIKNPGEFLWRNVVQPMRKAVEEDPIDSERRVQLAQWFNELWQVYQRDPRRFPRTKPEPDQFPFEIYETLLEAERIDPLGKSVYMSLYQSFLAFAQRQRDERNRVVQLLQAAEALRRLHERADPRNPRVLYQLAATWREIGDGQRVREYAAQALELNEQFPPSSRRLNVFQESALREWLNDPQGGVKTRSPGRR